MPKKSQEILSTSINPTVLKKIIIAFCMVELFLVVCIVVLFYLTLLVDSSRVIHIPKGNISSIITYLNKNNYDLNFVDKSVVRLIGYPQSGWIDLQATDMTKADFLYKLTTSKAAIESITLVPGETSYLFFQEIANKFQLDFEKLLMLNTQYGYKDEGNILAETYHLPKGMSEKHLVSYLLNFSTKKYQFFSEKIFGEYNPKSWYIYLTIASIIQKEAANTKEMPLVSSVIYNRLEKGMKLQMDGTLNYGRHSHSTITSKMIRTDKSPYNTYKHEGLPPQPICNVSLDAIKAAIFPAQSPYLYFVKNKKTRMHIFSTSYQEHKKNIAQQKNIKTPTASANKKRSIKQKATKNTKAPKREKKEVRSIKSLWKSVQ